MKLSVLIPALPSRFDKLVKLFDKISVQATDEVEVLAFVDNKRRSTGLKRDALVKLAKGDYIVMIDDDDDVADCFIEKILSEVDTGVDLITFNQSCSINGENDYTVRFSLDYENEESHTVDGIWVDVKRKPFHNMVWKRELAISEDFSDLMNAEDWDWAKRLIPKVKSTRNIDEILTYYKFNIKTTEVR